MKTSQVVRKYPKLQSYHGAEQRKLLILGNRIRLGVDNLDGLVTMGVVTPSQALALKYHVHDRTN